MTTFRPGPPRIAVGRCPGGLIVHVYGEDGRRILTQRLTSLGQAEAQAIHDGDLTKAALRPGEACCVVAFDGDTGERWSPADWAVAMAAHGSGAP